MIEHYAIADNPPRIGRRNVVDALGDIDLGFDHRDNGVGIIGIGQQISGDAIMVCIEKIRRVVQAVASLNGEDILHLELVTDFNRALMQTVSGSARFKVNESKIKAKQFTESGVSRIGEGEEVGIDLIQNPAGPNRNPGSDGHLERARKKAEARIDRIKDISHWVASAAFGQLERDDIFYGFTHGEGCVGWIAEHLGQDGSHCRKAVAATG